MSNGSIPAVFCLMDTSMSLNTIAWVNRRISTLDVVRKVESVLRTIIQQYVTEGTRRLRCRRDQHTLRTIQKNEFLRF